MDNNKTLLLKAIKAVSFITLLFILIGIFGWYALALILGYAILRTLMETHLTIRKRLLNVLRIIIKTTIIFSLIFYLKGWGIIGIIILTAILGAYKIWLRNDQFMEGVRDIETRIWGKPAEDMKPGEKRPKIKWNKKDLGK